MKIPVARTRIVPPPVPSDLPPRPRVQEALDAAALAPIVGLVAGAGCGKTVALAAWAARHGAAWYTAAPGDDDRAVFLAHVAAALGIAVAAPEDESRWRSAADSLVNALADGRHPGSGVGSASGIASEGLDRDKRPQSVVSETSSDGLNSFPDRLRRSAPQSGDAYLVVDDAHHLADAGVREVLAYLLQWMPPGVHVVLSGRRLPEMREWSGWRVRGRAVEVGVDVLRFTGDEAVALEHARWGEAPSREPISLALRDEEIGEAGSRFSPDELERVQRSLQQIDEAARNAGPSSELEFPTGGWSLAMDLLTRRPRPQSRWNVVPPSISREVRRERFRMDPTDALCAYILDEVWCELPDDLRAFVDACCLLDLWTEPLCAAVTGRGDAPAALSDLVRHSLLRAEADGFRMHQIFLDFARSQADSDERRLRTARALAAAGLAVDAIPLLVAAGHADEAAAILEGEAPTLLSQARPRRVLALTHALGEALDAHPLLRVARGHAHRQMNAYEDALAEFEAAARSSAAEPRALAGAARVYVDTLQPARAHPLLRRAFRLLPRDAAEERAGILDMLAENCVNQGRAHAALRYRRRAGLLRAHPQAAALDARLLLRTGRLLEARAALQARLESDGAAPGNGQQADAHREDVLILAYLAALEGDADTAERAARRGLEIAAAAGSAFTEAVAWMRLGHALQIRADAPLEESLACYARAQALAERVGVARVRAEALMGMALACAERGDVPASYAHATEGMALTREAGDAWLSAWLRLAAGLAGVAGRHPDAAGVLEAARADMQGCRDAFGAAVADLWLGRAAEDGAAAERSVRERGYGFLLERRTLFGPRDAGRGGVGSAEAAGRSSAGSGSERGGERAAAADGSAQASGGSSRAESGGEPAAHPTLRVQCLGTLRVWRDGVEIPSRAWKREKARELFGVLLARRGSVVQKEALMDVLFPEAAPEAANRDFRVAMHALSEALDPDRPRNAVARWIERRGTGYTLRREGALTLDADELERLAERGAALESSDAAAAMECWRRALELYRGDFLEEQPYAEWSAVERDRLREVFVATGERLARRAFESGDDAAALAAAQAILARDRCWEEAWRILMRVHLRGGRAFLAARAYEECAAALEDELGVAPSEETEALHAQCR